MISSSICLGSTWGEEGSEEGSTVGPLSTDDIQLILLQYYIFFYLNNESLFVFYLLVNVQVYFGVF